MKIEERKRFVERIKTHLKAHLENDERKPGVHVSDLIFPRKTFWRRIREHPLTDAEMGYFIAGRAHHQILQVLLEHPDFHEVPVELDEIHGTVDIFGEDVIEIKTTRSPIVHHANKLPDHWLEQLGMYVSMVYPTSRKGVGYLVIFYLGVRSEGNIPMLKAYKITFENLDAIREKMKLTRLLLQEAVASSNPVMIPYCPDWLCKKGKKGECAYYSPCKTKPEFAWGTKNLE